MTFQCFFKKTISADNSLFAFFFEGFKENKGWEGGNGVCGEGVEGGGAIEDIE